MLKTMGFLPIMPQINHKIIALEGVLQSEPLRQANEAFKCRGYGVEYKNVTFGYGEEEVIKDISFTMNSNEITALVGESGSGKSTLAKLLIHYYDIKSGQILIGGQDITEMSLVELNNQISYVGQDNYLFNISILENIRLEKPNATNTEVMDAARKAECMEFINRLSKGIHTLAGEGGKALSGGQKQRIVLARAILKDSSIVVLDEATAFIDPENEDKIHNAIKSLVKNKTLLIIAHKLNSIKDADNICILNKGNLEESGTHQELLEKSPTYNKLWNAQQKAAVWNPKELEVGE